jgi:hypothetical protein
MGLYPAAMSKRDARSRFVGSALFANVLKRTPASAGAQEVFMIRRMILPLLAVCAVVVCSAAAAGSASAEVFKLEASECTGGTNVALCWSAEEAEASPLKELVGKQSETVSGGDVMLTVSNPEITILCTGATGSGTISQPEPLVAGKKTTLTGTITYSGCTIEASAAIAKKCKIPTSKTTKELLGTLTSGTELLLAPASGTEFITIEFENNGAEVCPATIKGNRTVVGEQVVTITNPTKHELTKSGTSVVKSKLKFFEEPAELTESLTLSFTGLEDWVDVSTTA